MNEDPRRDPGLFDLPLDAPPPGTSEVDEPAESTPPRSRERERLRTLPLFDASSETPEEPAIDSRQEAALRGRPVGVPSLPSPRFAPLARRLAGAAGDLVILAAAGVLAAAGAGAMGVTTTRDHLPALLLFVLVFSFLYSVVPLAFWGSTPGMSWAGLVARTGAGEPLSFGQTALRWLASWVTWVSLGLLGLLSLTGRSLTDRLSGSGTYVTVALEAP